MNTLKHMFMVLALAVALPAMAITLDAARSQGLVGEANSGYIAIVSESSPALEQLVSEVNGKRKREYAAIAKRNGISIAQVAARAAEKLEARLPSGAYYQDSRGRWVQK